MEEHPLQPAFSHGSSSRQHPTIISTMEFENVNNYNIALEAQAKKTPKRIFASAARFIKKLVRRAKSNSCTCVARSQEEIDNDLNEQLEAKMSMTPQESDLRNFHHVTYRQIPSGQVAYS